MKTMYKNKNLPITKHLSFISPSPSKKENEPEKRTRTIKMIKFSSYEYQILCLLLFSTKYKDLKGNFKARQTSVNTVFCNIIPHTDLLETESLSQPKSYTHLE